MRTLLLFAYLVTMPLLMHAQIRIVIDKVPDITPATDSIFLAATFNNWNPGDKNFLLKKDADGRYSLTLPSEIMSFEYKFTRGSWQKVEAFPSGSHRANRICIQDGKKPITITATIEGWEDLSRQVEGITLLVEKLPENTPHDATIYVVGSFNGWNPGDPNYVMHKLKDGGYALTLPTSIDNFEYKFTRGNWSSVEGRSNGRAIPNRSYRRNSEKKPLIKAQVESWEDLSGDPINVYTFTLILAAFQGFLLILAINGIQNNNRSANTILSVIIVLISLSLLSRVSTYDRGIFQQSPWLILLPDMILFLYAPCFFMYMQNLLTIPSKNALTRWLHFVPFLVHVLLYAPLLFMGKQQFIDRIVDQDLRALFAGVGLLALFYNLFYWIRCYRMLTYYKQAYNDAHSLEQNLNYLSTVMILKAVCLVVWLFAGFTFITDLALNWNTRWLTDYSTDAIWLLFSCFTYCLGYYAINQPQIFKVKVSPQVMEVPLPIKEKTEEPEGQQVAVKDDILPMKEKLLGLMEHKKPFLNPKLTLGELSEMMDVNTHTLSRVINEGFDMNFYDFVNGYRIEEFKKLANQDSYKHQTLLAVALDVGFNSKTAFNRAFKKITNLTPSEYLKTVNNTSIEMEEVG